MSKSNQSKIIIKKLKKFELDSGDVFHALKASESEYQGFQEAYFSTIKKNKIKAWKRHYKMTMNLIVPIGKVQFIFYNEDRKSTSFIGHAVYGWLVMFTGIERAGMLIVLVFFISGIIVLGSRGPKISMQS